MEVIDVVKALVVGGISGIEMCLDRETGEVYYDLKSGAKSHLHLYEGFVVKGRYGYENRLDIAEYTTVSDVMGELFLEFKKCFYGRDFYNPDWMELGVMLGLVEKKVTTTTHVSYK